MHRNRETWHLLIVCFAFFLVSCGCGRTNVGYSGSAEFWDDDNVSCELLLTIDLSSPTAGEAYLNARYSILKHAEIAPFTHKLKLDSVSTTLDFGLSESELREHVRDDWGLTSELLFSCEDWTSSRGASVLEKNLIDMVRLATEPSEFTDGLVSSRIEPYSFINPAQFVGGDAAFSALAGDLHCTQSEPGSRSLELAFEGVAVPIEMEDENNQIYDSASRISTKIEVLQELNESQVRIDEVNAFVVVEANLTSTLGRKFPGVPFECEFKLARH